MEKEGKIRRMKVRKEGRKGRMEEGIGMRCHTCASHTGVLLIYRQQTVIMLLVVGINFLTSIYSYC